MEKFLRYLDENATKNKSSNIISLILSLKKRAHTHSIVNVLNATEL